jgi:phosphoglycerol geranylgeranyltransferase
MNNILTANIYSLILSNRERGKKMLALLIDPDKFESDDIIDAANESGVDIFLVGGSLITNGNIENCIASIKAKSAIPVLLFPGSIMQVTDKADAVLLLSLISGRNSDMLIGNHVQAAPMLKASKLEIIPTGYILIDGGKQTTVSYISNTMPIPSDKADIAVVTAMAGEMLGLKMIYLEAGSGAINPVPLQIIKKVHNAIDVPLFVGGGITDEKKAADACNAGADVIVIGTAAERNVNVLKAISTVIKKINK